MNSSGSKMPLLKAIGSKRRENRRGLPVSLPPNSNLPPNSSPPPKPANKTWTPPPSSTEYIAYPAQVSRNRSPSRPAAQNSDESNVTGEYNWRNEFALHTMICALKLASSDCIRKFLFRRFKICCDIEPLDEDLRLTLPFVLLSFIYMTSPTTTKETLYAVRLYTVARIVRLLSIICRKPRIRYASTVIISLVMIYMALYFAVTNHMLGATVPVLLNKLLGETQKSQSARPKKRPRKANKVSVPVVDSETFENSPPPVSEEQNMQQQYYSQPYYDQSNAYYPYM